ncbi:MAG: HD-GYP domain-containing protein [Actinomycetota bacterium]
MQNYAEQGFFGRIVIVDRDEMSLSSLARIFEEAGLDDVVCVSDREKLIPIIEGLVPDLLLVSFPVREEIALIDGLRKDRVTEHIPIIALTDEVGSHERLRMLEVGANDVVSKPFDPAELVLRARHLLLEQSVHVNLKNINKLLEDRVLQRTRQLEHAERELLEKLALAAEYRDDATGLHIRRIGENAARVAARMNMSSAEVGRLKRAAALHDVGKIAVPDAILLKPGPLSQDEVAIIRMHTIVGGEILSKSWFPLLEVAGDIALHHHERWDGEGYPEGLKGTQIPLVARIVSVVDSFDTLTHERSYKSAWPKEIALDEIRACSGSQFDPEVVEAFLGLESGDDSHTSSFKASGF